MTSTPAGRGAPIAPVAAQRPHLVQSPHGTCVDEYYWMRDDDPKVKRAEIIEYLQAENARHRGNARAACAVARGTGRRNASSHQGGRQLRAAYDNGYWTWRRFTIGAEYPTLLRRRGSPDGPDAAAPEEVLLDIPELARGHAYFSVGALPVSPQIVGPAHTRAPSAAACTRRACATPTGAQAAEADRRGLG